MKKSCELCGGKYEYIYNLNGYSIIQCTNCKTTRVETMPTQEELNEYYNGFKYCINESNMSLILNNHFKKWFKSFNLPNNARMLDIGGGNGYFSLAFEYFGYGKATYVDLDPQACEYVKTLGIHSVINDNVNNLAKYSNDKYDFIYSRHVIEHLTNPLKLVNSAIDLLSDDGVLVLQFPNNISYEFLTNNCYIKQMTNSLKENNKLTDFEIHKILYSNKICATIAPPRHLWGFTQKGWNEFLRKIDNIEYTIKTFDSRDKIYSPYLYKNLLTHLRYWWGYIFLFIKKILRFIYSIPHGKTHLVIFIKKKKN